MQIEKGLDLDKYKVQYRITLSEDEAVAVGYTLEDSDVDHALLDLQFGHLVRKMRDELLQEVEG